MGATWACLRQSGLAVLHAVKCGIRPTPEGFQNPPRCVVDTCAPRHLALELAHLAPAVVLTLGDMPYRAVVRAVQSDMRIRALKFTNPPLEARPGADGFTVETGDRSFTLLTSRFPRGRGRNEARGVLRQAATKAGLRPSTATS